MAVFGCRSLVLVINNQVLNKIKIAVGILSQKGHKYDKTWWKYEVINILENYTAHIKNFLSNYSPYDAKSVICGVMNIPCCSKVMAFSNKHLFL